MDNARLDVPTAAAGALQAQVLNTYPPALRLVDAARRAVAVALVKPLLVVKAQPAADCPCSGPPRYAALSTLITQTSRSLVLIKATGTTGILIPNVLKAARMRAA